MSNPTPLTIDLSGPWQVRTTESPVTEATLPGALAAQGFGEEPGFATTWVGSVFDHSWYEDVRFAEERRDGSVRVPFWLQPRRVFTGEAWFQKVVTVPEAALGRRAVLFLERPHWQTRVWWDGRDVGSNDSLSTPHVYDLGVVTQAGDVTLVIRVDNRILIPVGPNSHSISDHTQGNWNGIAGALRLTFENLVHLGQVAVFPSVARRSALVRCPVTNAGATPVRARLRVSVPGRPDWPVQASAAFEVGPGERTESLELRLPADTPLWDEFSPAVHLLIVELIPEDTPAVPYDVRQTVLGLREAAVSGSQITVNGRPLFLRGTLECCVFPRTGYPPTDVGAWKRLFARVQEHGLNHVRFHSWCPPEAAFAAADELGLYLQIECATWANQGAGVGVDPGFDSWLHRESERIVAWYGNHPSFLLMAYGNEPDGRTEDFLGLWVQTWRHRDGRRLYTSGAGWPAIPESDYHNLPQPRIQAWGEGLASRINGRPPETVSDYRRLIESYGKPCISHEIGQWCAFPNFNEIEKYTGLFQAKNFELFRDLLAKNGMAHQARDFLIASGKLQVACYKEEIESALRTPGFGGFQLLGLSDFPGQGTALVGVVDAFWESKGYVEPEEFREFCGPTVPLARMARRYWTPADTFVAGVEIAHFGAGPLFGAEVRWAIRDGDRAVLEGRHPVAALPAGRLSPVFSIHQPLVSLAGGRRYQLVVTLHDRPENPAAVAVNRWDFWVFDDCPPLPVPPTIHLGTQLDDEARAVLDGGGDVLLTPSPETVRSEVALGFSSIFWNTSWTQGQAPHTLGIVCDPAHPVFRDFPTRSYSDWLWWDLVQGASALVLDALPQALKPLVQPIDTWHRSHKLGLIFEARVGNGRLVVAGLDLTHNLESRPAVRQFRHSLLGYMTGPDFSPQVRLEVGDESLSRLFGSD